MEATLIERSAVRMTPAGTPVLELRLHHHSATVEAGLARQLDFDLDAIALGDAARRLAEVKLGQALRVQGFLAPRSKRGTRLRLHVTEYVRCAPVAGARHGNEIG